MRSSTKNASSFARSETISICKTGSNSFILKALRVEIGRKPMMETILLNSSALSYLIRQNWRSSKSENSEVDDALSLAQTHRQSISSLTGGAPLFRLVATEREWECSGHDFSTVYEGYKYALWWPYRDSAWDEMLVKSHDTIRHLAITLDHATVLSNFHHLERLSLRLSQRHPGSPMPTDVDQNLLRLLPTLPSVRFLNPLPNHFRHRTFHSPTKRRLCSLPPSNAYSSLPQTSSRQLRRRHFHQGSTSDE